MLRFVLLSACCVAATVAIAEPQPLSGHTIRATFAGATIKLDTPLAATVPIHYHDNGQVSGEAGNLSWVLGSATDKGRWWVEKDRLCHKWTTWFEAENQCLRLRQEGDRLFWVRDDGKTGTATLIAKLQPPPVQIQTYAAMMPPPAPAKVLAPPSMAGMPVSPQVIAAPTPVNPAPVKIAALSPAPKPKTLPPKRAVAALVASPVTLVQPAPPTKPAPVVSAVAFVPTFMVAGVSDGDVLYVRNGPSMDHASIGALLPQAQGVKILGSCQQEWCPVAHNGVKGWVNTYYLVAENPSRSPPLAQSQASERR
ncbi:MAG: SH3 domain-containing protein [Hyphomicrobiaceae bacterium]